MGYTPPATRALYAAAAVGLLDIMLPGVVWAAAGGGCTAELTWIRTQIVDFTFATSLFDAMIVGIVRSVLFMVCAAVATRVALWSGVALALCNIAYSVVKIVYVTPVVMSISTCAVSTLLVVCAAMHVAFSVAELFVMGAIMRTQESLRRREDSLPLMSTDGLAAESSGTGDDTQKRGTSLIRVLSLAKPYWRSLSLGIIGLLVSGIASLLIPSYFGQVIDSVVAQHDEGVLVNAVVELCIVVLVSSAASFFRAWMFTRAGYLLASELRKDLFRAIMTQEVHFFDTNRTGELTNRLASDTQVIQNAATVNISITIRYVLQIVGSIVVIFVLSWSLTLIMLSVVPVVTIGAVIYGRGLKRMRKRFQDLLAASTATADESISNIRTVRSFANEERQQERYSKEVDQSMFYGNRISFANGLFQGVAGIAAQLVLALVLWYGGKLVLESRMSAGTLISFLFYTFQVAMSFALLSTTYGDFMQAVGASSRVFQILDRKPAIRFRGGETPAVCRGEIALQNVRFSYPSRPDAAVLHGLHVRIMPGKVLAIVGMSGGGKSTIVSLLERFYEATAGTVMIDGVDVRSLDPKWLHAQVALVSQEPVLFAASIRENIAFGRESASMDDIERVAKEANAYDFVNSFPEKFETAVGERGVRLSGGQKQRIAIARALLMDPKILLLDEATSALDSESESVVQQAIDRIMVGRTVIVVAHRLSTIKNADTILVMDSGRVVESGTHAELMDRRGVYRRLVKRQLAQSKQRPDA